MINKFTALLIVRLGFGINMLMHGLVRIPKLEAFVNKTSVAFNNNILPQALVKAFLYGLPFAEFLTGVLVLAGGRFGRYGFALGALIITALLFGTTIREEWAGAGSQMVYILIAAFGMYLYERKESIK